jgi:hypothetical protein
MKLLLIFIIGTMLLADKPPAPPKTILPKECKTIPPMIIFLPPPMEAELIPCKNAVFKPTMKMVKKRFPKAKSVAIADGFERLYRITLENNTTLFCNRDLSKCIKGEELR